MFRGYNLRVSMRNILPGLLILGLVAACSSDTGILIRTTTHADFNESISSLRFFVGQDTIEDNQYYSDSDPLDEVSVKGRDIKKKPYKVLLRPDGETTGGIAVAVVAYDDSGNLVGFGQLPDLVEFVDGSVVEWVLEIGSAGPDVQVTDSGCLEWEPRGGVRTHIGTADDQDCDGVLAGDGPDDDCNDLDPFQSPNTPENCFNNIDDNCNGLADFDDTEDHDNDTYAACGPDGTIDCNDNEASVHPGAEELCDGLDNDCNSECDEGYDGDHDGVTAPCGSIIEEDDQGNTICVGMGDMDCINDDDNVFPGNVESCDGIDNDCNQICDDDMNLDPDNDGYTSCGSRIGFCGISDAWIDCDPDDYLRHPGAHELCDNIDNNCDGNLDPNTTPCFEAIPECKEGYRNCQNGVPVGSCNIDQPAIKSELPSEWCSTYQSCDQDQQIVDAFECNLTLGAGLNEEERCRVQMTSPTSVCDNAVAKIQHSGEVLGGACSYTLIGGSPQQGYKVGLIDPASGLRNERQVSGCTAGINIVGIQQPWPGNANIPVLFVTSDGMPHEIKIILEAELVESCGGLPGLICDTWSNSIPTP